MSLKGPAFFLIKGLTEKQKSDNNEIVRVLKKSVSPKERETAHKDKFWTRRQLKNVIAVVN